MDGHTYHPTALACLYRKTTVAVISVNWVMALLVFTLALVSRPSARPGDLPPGRPDVIGRVRSVAGDSITLDTPQGPRLVTVNDETEVKRAEGEASLEDIEPGTPIAVFGQFDGGGKTLVAQVVVILPAPPKR